MNPIVMFKVIPKTMKSIFRMIRLKSGNWPELSRYCCCQLSTGIYIRSILNLVFVSILFAINGCGLSSILSTIAAVDGVTVTLMGDRYNKTVTEDELLMFHNMLKAFKIYLILWMILKFIYVLSILAGFYAIFFNKAKILKSALYAMILNWIFDFIIAIGAKTFISLPIHVLFILAVSTELYHLIAINSKYKQMAFKSQIVPEDALSPTTASTFSAEAWNPNMHHGTCVCSSNYMEIRSERTTIASVSVPQTPSENATFVTGCKQEDKIINFKDGPIIFDQEQLQPSDSIFTNSSRGRNEEGQEIYIERCDTRSLECLDIRHLNENDSRRPKTPNSLAL